MRQIIIEEGGWLPFNTTASRELQCKWYNPVTNEFLKEALLCDYKARDYFVEEIGTAILNQINTGDFRYASYSACRIKAHGYETYGCISPNF